MIAIEAENLGKSYRSNGGGAPTVFGKLKSVMSKAEAPKPFWAVRNLNYQIKKGSTVGIIGPNGSGKSSTLGLTAGTINPSEGTIRTDGRISSLLELGAGFHIDLTGRENVFLNAALLGIAREDIKKRLDHIIEFSELGEFIDQPVKTYSSGMYVRLGFAVALETNPEILLVDEVLAVGDMRFQNKCIEAMQDFKKQGKTIMFVSHDLGMVQRFCDEVMYIHEGAMVDRGEPDFIIGTYHKKVYPELHKGEETQAEKEAPKDEANKPELFHQHEHGNREIEITKAWLSDDQGTERTRFKQGEAIRLTLHFTGHQKIQDPVIGFSLKSSEGLMAFGTNTEFKDIQVGEVFGERTLTVNIGHTEALQAGEYRVGMAIHSADHLVNYHRMEDWLELHVEGKSDGLGAAQLDVELEF